MTAVLYAHIPGLQIDKAEVPFAGGRLARLPFDDWIALESEFEYADRKYAKADPVFWIRDLVMDGELTQEALARAVYDAVWPAHTAFLLDESAPLIPTPALSCCYVARPAPPELMDTVTRSVARLMGPIEREFIVYGSPLTYEYSAEDLSSVEDLYRFIESSSVRDWSGDVRAGIEVLEETARPDSWYGGDTVICQLHGFVRCMAATESILLPPEEERGKGETTQTFGRHAAALLAPFPEDRDRAAKYFADLYRFRSELMHGRSIPDQKDPSDVARLREGRQLLRNVAYAALILRNAIPDAAPLALLLKESWHDPDRQSTLAAILKKGMHP
jgi:hypothetical protein